MSRQSGWALVGKVCGHTHDRCPAVYATRNGGGTWRRLAPAGALPTLANGCERGKACVGAIRFVTPRIGYLFGPALFMTTNGGRAWTHVPGLPVESLAFSGSGVFRLVYQHTGCPGPCRPVLQRSKPGGRVWTTLGRWRNWSRGFGDQVLAGGANLYTVFYGHIAGGAGSAHATIEVSHDRGRTWKVRGDPCGYAGAHEEDAFAVAAAGRSVGILCISRDVRGPDFTALSRNAGRRFTSGAPLHMIAPEQIAVDGGSGIAVGNGGVTGGGRFNYELALSGNGGKTWRIAIHQHKQLAEDLAAGSLQFVSPRDLSWVGYPYLVWKSSHGGKRWHKDLAP
jgi:hypothetical protein